MQAIVTKFLPCTNTKPNRIKASCERGSVIISWPELGAQEACHVYAAQYLVNKFIKEDAERYGQHVNPWSLPRVVGFHPKVGYVHVFTK